MNAQGQITAASNGTGGTGGISTSAIISFGVLPSAVNVSNLGNVDWAYWGNSAVTPTNMSYSESGVSGWRQAGSRTINISAFGTTIGTAGGGFPTTTFSFNAGDCSTRQRDRVHLR